MDTQIVILSPKFQVVVPKEARRALGLQPKQRLMVLTKERQLLLIPIEEDLRKVRGIFPRMDLSDVRDHSDRF